MDIIISGEEHILLRVLKALQFMILSTVLWQTGIFTYPILAVIKKDGLVTWPLPTSARRSRFI